MLGSEIEQIYRLWVIFTPWWTFVFRLTSEAQLKVGEYLNKVTG